jgi:hypothetical protein
MRILRSFLFISVAPLLFAKISFAQKISVGSSSGASSANYAQLGPYVGFDYMNLTDVQATQRIAGQGQNIKVDSKFGTHLGMGGVSFGYNQSPDRGFGFRAGVRLMDSLNQSEYKDDRMQIFLPESSFVYAFNSYFLTYAGINYAVWLGSDNYKQFRPNIGGQGGFGLRFSRNVSWNLGYTMMRQSLSEEFLTYNVKTEIQLSGFNTNLVYNF